MRIAINTAALAIAMAGFLVVPAFAADHEIHMMNKGEAGTMVFEPAFIQAQPGAIDPFHPVQHAAIRVGCRPERRRSRRPFVDHQRLGDHRIEGRSGRSGL